MMKLRGNLGKIALAAVICAAILYLVFPLDRLLGEDRPALGFVAHENPDNMENESESYPSSIVISPEYLNLISGVDREEIKDIFSSWPMSRYSPKLDKLMIDTIVSSMKLSDMGVEINGDIGEIRALMEAGSASEATRQSAQASYKLAQAGSELDKLEESIEAINENLASELAPEDYETALSYEGFTREVREVTGMINQSRELFASTDATLNALLKSQNVTLSELEITLEDTAYPGLPTTVSGSFGYGTSAPLESREVTVYLDDTPIAEVAATAEFTCRYVLDAQTATGKHVITVSSPAAGSYSPVVESAVLDVAKALPEIALDLPRIAVLPGVFGASGTLYSGDYPLEGAAVIIIANETEAGRASSAAGAFDTGVRLGSGPGVFGTQELTVRVVPEEPWLASTEVTGSLLTINVIYCAALIIAALFVVIYLPRRLRVKAQAGSGDAAPAAMPQTQPLPAPTPFPAATDAAMFKDEGKPGTEPGSIILYWYRRTLRLLQRLLDVTMKPQQTLREYSRETEQRLGPLAGLFTQLIGSVERLLYSPRRPTPGDAEAVRKLAGKIAAEAGPEISHGAAASQPRASTVNKDTGAAASPRQRPETWLWVLLLAAIAYFAIVFLFLLPLLGFYISCLPVVTIPETYDNDEGAGR